MICMARPTNQLPMSNFRWLLQGEYSTDTHANVASEVKEVAQGVSHFSGCMELRVLRSMRCHRLEVYLRCVLKLRHFSFIF